MKASELIRVGDEFDRLVVKYREKNCFGQGDIEGLLKAKYALMNFCNEHGIEFDL